jgi:hypothetical protein
MAPKRKTRAPRTRKRKAPPKTARLKTKPRSGRKKNAPAKPAAGETLGEAILRYVYGRFYNDDLLQWISAASLMTPDEEAQLRRAAALETDAQRQRSILEAADLVRDSRSDLDRKVSQKLVPALLQGDPIVFENIAAIIRNCYKDAGAPRFDGVRHQLLIKHQELCLRLRRPPTIDELKEPLGPPFPPDTIKNMDLSQLGKMLGPTDLKLALTPKPLVTALQRISRLPTGLADLRFVKNVLRRQKNAALTLERKDHELLCFAESPPSAEELERFHKQCGRFFLF